MLLDFVSFILFLDQFSGPRTSNLLEIVSSQSFQYTVRVQMSKQLHCPSPLPFFSTCQVQLTPLGRMNSLCSRKHQRTPAAVHRPVSDSPLPCLGRQAQRGGVPNRNLQPPPPCLHLGAAKSFGRAFSRAWVPERCLRYLADPDP